MSFKRDYILALLGAKQAVDEHSGLVATCEVIFLTSMGIVKGKIIEPLVMDGLDGLELKEKIKAVSARVGFVNAFHVAKLMVCEGKDLQEWVDKSEVIELEDVSITDAANKVHSFNYFTLFADQVIGYMPLNGAEA